MRRTPHLPVPPLMLLVVGALLLPVLAPTAAAGGDPARLAQVLLVATPTEQAVDGQIEVVAHAYLQGNPHKTLYAEQIRASISFGGNASAEIVTGPDPAHIPVLEVPASVATFPADFVWRIRATTLGSLTVRANVTTLDSGTVLSQVVSVAIKTGIGVAATRHAAAEVGDRQPLREVVNITNPFTTFPLLDVRLCSHLFPGTPPTVKATGDGTLELLDGTTLTGVCVPMLPVEPASINWTGTIPAQPRTGTLVVWVFAKTANSEAGGESRAIRVYSESAVRNAYLGAAGLVAIGTALLGVLFHRVYRRGMGEGG